MSAALLGGVAACGASVANDRSYCDVVAETREELLKVLARVSTERTAGDPTEAARVAGEVVRKRATAAPPDVRDDFDVVVRDLDAGRTPSPDALREIGRATVAQCGGVDDLSPRAV